MCQCKGHAAHSLAGGHAVHRRGDFSRAVLKLALELADEERGFLLIALLKDQADAHQHGPCHREYDGSDGQREQQEQLLP